MAAPNIINATTITGKTTGTVITTTGNNVASNPSSSGKVLKVNALYVSNIDGTDNSNVSIDIVIAGTGYSIASTIGVPADSTIDVLSKPIYLEENHALKVTAGADGDIEAVCSYEEIS